LLVFDAGHLTPPVAAQCPNGLAREAARRVSVTGVVEALEGLGVLRAGAIAAHENGEANQVALLHVGLHRHGASLPAHGPPGHRVATTIALGEPPSWGRSTEQHRAAHPPV
jgi:hypothetical protein